MKDFTQEIDAGLRTDIDMMIQEHSLEQLANQANLTRAQFAECIRQAFWAGDFQKYVRGGSPHLAKVEYIPFQECERLRAEIAKMESGRRWIRVEEALPHHREVVVALSGSRAEPFIAYHHHSINKWRILMTDGDLPSPVTHWLRLPEAPQRDPAALACVHKMTLPLIPEVSNGATRECRLCKKVRHPQYGWLPEDELAMMTHRKIADGTYHGSSLKAGVDRKSREFSEALGEIPAKCAERAELTKLGVMVEVCAAEISRLEKRVADLRQKQKGAVDNGGL